MSLPAFTRASAGIAPVARCASCFVVRDLSELVAVETIATGARWYVCRSSVSDVCFRRAVKSVYVHRIAATKVPADD